MSVAIGFDVGTSGLKALAISEDGEVVGRAEVEYGLSTPQARVGRAGPEDWWRAAQRRSSSSMPTRWRGSGCRARCTASSRSTKTRRCCGRRSCGTTSARGRSARRSSGRIGLDALIAATGNRALTGFTAPKLLWLEQHEPEIHERIAHILLPKDYVRLKLCGERAIDVADASGTLLFDVAHRKWSEEVCEALNVPTEWLPRALESAAVSGETSDGIPVAAGAGDQAAGALGRRGHARGRAAVGRARHRRAWCSRRCRRSRPTRRRASTPSATRCRTPGTRWA
jgi:xylulokinase